MPKISVIVPCYNVENYVSKCLISLTKQTLKDIEIICIDDKSTDNTLQILRKFAKNDERIKVIALKKNHGAAYARNTGIKKAIGTYVGFVDPDDYIDLDFYENLYNATKEKDYDVVKGSFFYHDLLDNSCKESNMNDKININLIEFCGEHVSAIYKRKFLLDNNLFYPEELVNGEDSVFLSKIVVKYPKIITQNNTFYHYFYNRTGSLDSRSLSHAKTLGRIKMLDYKIEILSKTQFLTNSDKKVFIKSHILAPFNYALNKIFEKEEDKKLLFEWLVNARLPKNILQKNFGKRKVNFILKNNYNKFIALNNYRKTSFKNLIKRFFISKHKKNNYIKYYILCYLPILKIKFSNSKTYYKLFHIIPTIKSVKRKEYEIFYLFNIFKIYKRNLFNTIQNRYKHNIKKLKNTEKIRIGFLVWENCKWSYEYLYQKFLFDNKFEVYVLLVNEKHKLCNLENNKIFFKNYNYVVINDINDLKKLNIRIVFYEQPWFAVDGEFSPINVSKNALCFYVHYGINLEINEKIISMTEQFFRSLYKYFVFNAYLANSLKKYNINNTVVTGHPRLDVYLEPIKNKEIWKSKNKTRIIYAPHHSFRTSVLKWGTWEWNGQHILNLAKENKDSTEWIFKPHPRFKLELSQLLNSETKAQKYFDEWSKIAQIYDKGNYFDIFKTADLMISDCGSFKFEWLPTNKPYINLLTKYEDAAPYGEQNLHFASGYYSVADIKTLDKYFYMLIKEKKDPKKQIRANLIAEIPLGATNNIYNFIKNLLK